MGTIIAYIKWRFRLSKAERAQRSAPYTPQYAEPDLERIKNPDPHKMQLTWIGHATFLIQIAGMNILTDPIWSEYASPVQFAGPKRQGRPGIRFEDLPKIDIVLISHTHYDHLDRRTIRRLGNSPHYFIPMRMKWWFENEGVANISELDWWQSEQIGEIKISAVPAKHWSRRGIFTTSDAGWGGYVIESPTGLRHDDPSYAEGSGEARAGSGPAKPGVIYFAGDTGYDAEYFKEIGKKFPRIDLALIPIGAYYPQWFFGRFHVDPREAVIIHKEVGAKGSIGMHWGTFKLTEEPLGEPPKELARQRSSAGIEEKEFSVMKIGETRVL